MGYKILLRLKHILSNVTVEPIIFCNFLAIAFFRVAEQAGIYEVICIQKYQTEYGVDCKNLKIYPHVEDMVQKNASTVSMYLSLAYLIPAIGSDIFLGAWADKHGRKVNILLGLTGLVIAAYPFSIVLTYPTVSLTVLVVANIIAGLSGYIGIVMISSLAYMADIVYDKSTLTVRMAQVYVCYAAAGAIGSFAVGRLVKSAPLPYVILVTELILAVGFFYTLFRIRHVPPLMIRKLIADKVNNSGSPSSDERRGSCRSIDETGSIYSTVDSLEYKVITKRPLSDNKLSEDVVKTSKYIGNLYKDVARTFVRSRPGNRRCYLYLMSLVFFLFLIAELGLLHGPILGLYVFHRPFFWSPADLGYWKGAQSTLMLIGNLAGSWIMKKYLNFRDTTVILVALGSSVLHLTVVAFSNKTWLLYLAVVFGMFANLTLPTIKSFVAQLVDADEVGKAYTANGVTADLAFVTSTLVFNNIYTATVDMFAGLVFIFAALLLLICFCIILWIHYDYEKTELQSYLNKNGSIKWNDRDGVTITRF